jgi:hypothetical protein
MLLSQSQQFFSYQDRILFLRISDILSYISVNAEGCQKCMIGIDGALEARYSNIFSPKST